MNANQFMMGPDSQDWRPVTSVSFSSFQVDPTNLATTPVASFGFAFVGGSGENWQRVQTPSTFKSVSATAAGNTNVWLPALNLFILMGFQISVSGTLAATGTQTILLQDGAGGTIIWRGVATVSNPIAGDTVFPAVDLGSFGFQGTLGNTLIVNLSAAMTAGAVAVNAWGIEV